MPVTLTGRVFCEPHPQNPSTHTAEGIPDVFIVLEYPDHTLVTCTTDEIGLYSFANLTEPGLYILHETVLSATTTLPDFYPHPIGFTGSTTVRQYRITIKETSADQDLLLQGYDFGHDLREPFDNPYLGYQINPQTQELLALDCVTGKYHTCLKLPKEGLYGALSFNPLDYYLYGYDVKTHQVFRLDHTGHLVYYTLPLLPPKNFRIGDISPDGKLYLYQKQDHTYYIIDVNPTSPEYMQLIDTSPFISSLAIEDWSFNPLNDSLYAIASDGRMVMLNPYTHEMTSLVTTGNPPSACSACAFDYNGYFYALFSHTQTLYRFTISSFKAEGEVFTQLSHTFYNSLARCSSSPLYLTLGSAPDCTATLASHNYRTDLAHDGPRHGLTNLLFFGHTKGELPPALVDLDFTATTYTLELPLTNHSGKDAYLYAWIDFNQNGSFETAESITPLTVPAQLGKAATYTLKFEVPPRPDIVLGSTYMRLRLTTDHLTHDTQTSEDSRSFGPASDGDILDLCLDIIGLPPYLSNASYGIGEMNHPCPGQCEVIDPTQGTLTYSLQSAPHSGIVSVHPTSGSWEYLPTPDYTGSDTFTLCATSSLSELSCEIPISLDIQKADLMIYTTTQHLESQYKDTLSYVTTIENVGSLPMHHLHFTSYAPPELTFIPGSTLINNVQDKSSDPHYGLFLNQLLPGEIYVIRTDYTLSDSQATSVSFFASIEGIYSLAPDDKGIPFTKQSSPITTMVKSPCLEVVFSSSLQEAFVEDTIQYTVLLTNTGDTPLQNIKLTAILGMYLSYTKGVIVNYIPQDFDITKGCILPSLHPQEQTIVQFTTLLHQAPEHTLQVDSSLNYTYEYLLNHCLHPCTPSTLHHTLHVCTPSVSLTKTASKRSLSLGEVFTYTLTASNLNAFDLEEVVIREDYPSNFQVLEVRNDEGLVSNTLSSGICLGSLPAYSDLHLYVKLKITSPSSSKSPFTGVATGFFTFTVADTLLKKTLCVEAVDTEGIFITDAALLLEKFVSVSETALDEIVTYTLSLTNTGTVPLSDITIQDLLTPELKFIPKSVQVGAVPIPDASIISGITLSRLGVDCNQSICFDAQVLRAGNGLIENIATAYYTYTPHSSHITKSGQVTSNPCLLPIRHPHVTLTGQVTPDQVYLGDFIYYSLFITNDGDTDVFNVLLENSLTTCELVEGSFTVHDQIINSVDFDLPINIGRIKRGQTLPIQYCVKVSPKYHSSDLIPNIITIKFAYTTIDQHLKTGSCLPLKLTATLAVSTFKQLNIENTLELPTSKPDIDSINHISGIIQPLKHYLIATPKGTSVDGQILSGHKLIVHALLQLTIEYVSAEPKQSICSLYFSIPFSTFIVLPSDCPPHPRVYINSQLENISFKVLNNRSFFTNASLFVNAKIK